MAKTNFYILLLFSVQKKTMKKCMSCSGFLIIVTVISQNLYPARSEFLLVFATYFHAYFQIKYSDIFLDKFLFLK